MVTGSSMNTRERLEERLRRQKETAQEVASAARRSKEEKEVKERREREEQKKRRDEDRKLQDARQREQQRQQVASSNATVTKLAATEGEQGEAKRAKETNETAEGQEQMETDSMEGGDPLDLLRLLDPMLTDGEEQDEVARLVFPEDNEQDEINSPERKRKKKDKTKKKKKEAAPILKAGRFTGGVAEARNVGRGGTKTAEAAAAEALKAKEKAEEEARKAKEDHSHEHKRTVVECSVTCTSEDITQRYNEYPAAVRVLLKNIQKVDGWACLEPVEEGSAPRIWEPSAVPYDHTDLGNWSRFSGNAGSFEMRKTKKKEQGRNRELGDDDDLTFPEVYFTLAFSSDKDPYKILERVAGEWGKSGGGKLYIKEIASFETRTAINIFHLRNDNSFDIVLEELRTILTAAKERAEEEEQDGCSEFFFHELPSMSIRKQMPRISGLDTSVYQGWTGRQHDMRKSLHVEVDEEGVAMVQYLTEKAKSMGLFQKFWGNRVKVTLLMDTRLRRKGQKQSQQNIDMAALASYNRKHINYHSSTRIDGIRGVLDLDKPVPFSSVTDPTLTVGYMTLRRLLYANVKMQDGHQLFQEIHQGQPMGPVDVAVPYCEESERMMGMIQRNAAAYFYFHIKGGTVPDQVITDVLRASMDPTLVNGISDCKWDEKTGVLTTPADEDVDHLEKMEEAAWYNDEFGDHMVDLSRKEKRKFASKEALEELNCDHSHATVHKKKGTYRGSPGAPVFNVGKEAKSGEAGEEDSEIGDEEEGFKHLSNGELIALLKQHNISSKVTGSPPNSQASGSGRGAEEVDSNASIESSSAEDSASSKDDTSSSSAEEDTAVRKPDHGE